MKKLYTQSTKLFILLVFLSLICNLNAFSQYNGIHYVGLGEEFETIQEAVDSLVSQSVNGATSIIVKAKSGHYNEQVEITAIPGASSLNTITFQSETKNPDDVMIYYAGTGSSNNYVVLFNACSYVTFEYFKLVNSTLSSSYTSVIQFNGAAENNTVRYNTLIGESGSPTGNDEAVIKMWDDLLNYTEISHNTIQGGSYAIRFDAYGDGSSKVCLNTKINYNTFDSRLGIFLEVHYGVEIIGNEINTVVGNGIELLSCEEGIVVVNNKINSYSTSAHKGLYLDNSDGSIAFQGLIANNVIRVSGDNVDSNFGLHLKNSNYQNVYHNTVYVNNTGAGGYAFYAEGGSTIVVKNNLFTVANYGYAYGSSSSGSITVSDYNNYYTSGNFIANWGGANCAELSDLQVANSKDAASQAWFPSFISTSISGLIPQTHWLDGTGDNLTSTIDYDIDSISRPVASDIGAYEFTATNSSTYSGALTIGAAGTFTTFSEATDSLMKLGVSSAVTINVESNLYTEQIALTAIPGASASNTVTFQSASGDSTDVIWQYSSTSSSNNYVAYLNGADYITFKEMTIKNTGASYAHLFLFNGRASDITITNNVLDGNGTPSSSNDMVNLYASESNIDNLTVSNNIIKEGNIGIYMSGASLTEKAQGIVISNNDFTSHSTDIFLKWHTNFEISNNSFQGFTNSGNWIQSCTSPYQIKSNKYSSTSVTERGIYIDACDGTGDGGLIFNNFIHVENSSSSVDIRGIWIWNSFYQSFYNNSINVISTDNDSKGLQYDGYGGDGSNMIFKNNNIVVEGPGYPFFIENADATVSESDNNNLYTTGSYIANWSNSTDAGYNPVNFSDIASLTAYSGKDANSQNFNPSYVSESDLHINSYWLDGKGVQLLGLVTDDIDGETRLNPPDIGADEYPTATVLMPYDGEYTIGTTGRFATFNIAIDSLIERGILDTVIFKVQTGYYNEQFVIPLVAGISSDAVIIFESESGNAADAVITYNPGSGNNYLVRLASANYITFRNLSFQSGTDSYARIFSFDGKCENNNLTGNIFSGRSESSTSVNDAIIYTNGGIINNLSITNNTFLNGSLGLSLVNSSSSTGTDLVISDNTFSCYQQGIYVSWFIAPKIENNYITFSVNNGIGINVQNCSSAASYGMLIKNNQIYADVYTNSYGAMYIYLCDANPSFPGLIANNTIRTGVNSSSRSIGFYVNDCDYLNFYHNTVNISSNQSTDMAFYSNNSNYNNIVNNNFVIKGDVEDITSSLGYAMYINNGNIGTVDYNNYYSAGKYIAYWAGTNYGTLEELQVATGKDVHTINYFPGFRGENNLKMKSSWLDGEGTPLASVTEDIDGISRDGSNPDIGAYEYSSTLTPIATGTYTIASLGGDYPSLDSLTRALMERGISGSVNFELVPGSYTNTNISIKDIPGTNIADTVVIQSQSGDPTNTIISHIQESSQNYIIRFSGTDYLTIKDLTFNSGGSTYSRILYFEGNSQHVKILNNVFNGITSTGLTTNQASVYVPVEQIIDNLLIQGNEFNDNSYGIYFGGFLSYNNTNLIVAENTFNSQYRNIYFYRTKKPYIYGNIINAGMQEGIYLHECDNDLMVLNNKIFVDDDSYYAIYINYCDGTVANKGLIANNFVGVNGVSGNGSFGIKLDYSNYQQIFHNTINIIGSKGSCINAYQGGNLFIANNIFSNSGTTTYSLSVDASATISSSDYNNIYSIGTNNILYKGTPYTELSAYQSGETMDLNSVDYNPVLTSSTDFHLLGDSVVGLAIPLTSIVPYDFDGEDRDPSNPDIGADEFSCLFYSTPVVEDVIICANDSIPALYAEGPNIKWYSDSNLSNEVWSANEYDPGHTTAGIYTYYVTQSTGECTSDADSVVLTILAAPELAADITHIDCQGTDFGAINLSVSGSTASPFIYQWSNDEIYEDIDNLEAGDYVVTVEDLNSCAEIDTFTVTTPTPIILDIITEDTECDTSFGSATVLASGGEEPYDYRWTTGDSVTVVDDLYAGIYVVSVTDNRGCIETGIATVSDIGAPTIAVESITDVSCYGGGNGAINLTVSGGATPYTYEWSNGNTTSPDLNNINAGSYELIVNDNDGCQAIESYIIEEPDPIKISLNITETSCGQSNGAVEAIVTGGTISTDYTYEWYNNGAYTGITASDITELDLGVYNIDILDDNGCDARKYFTISEIGAPSVIVDSISQGTCGNADGGIYISAYGAYTSYTYDWSSGASTEDLIGVNPGTYNVTVSDAGGCNAVKVATIEADKPDPNPICMVTVDTASNYNEIIWEKQYTDGVDFYRVYKESTISDVYTEIGTVDVTEESVFVDQFSDVTQRSWRYKLAVVDVCGVESDLSDKHKTMHLTIGLGVGNTVNLIWNHYEGFDFETYYIHRRSNSGWELIDSVPSNLDDPYKSYTDHNPIFEDNLYYMIEVKHPSGGCDPAAKAKRGSSRSNVSKKITLSQDTESPSVPTSLATTEITATTISLIWVSSTDNVGVSAYEVYKDNVMLEEATDTVYTATGLTQSTSYAFFVKAKDDAGNFSAASSTLNVSTLATGIDIIDENIKHIKLYPNPTKGELVINIETFEKREIWYEVYTTNGILVDNGYLGVIQGNYESTVNMINQPNGMYFVKIISNSGIQVKSIILNK